MHNSGDSHVHGNGPKELEREDNGKLKAKVLKVTLTLSVQRAAQQCLAPG